MRKPKNRLDAGDCPRGRKTKASAKIKRKNLEEDANGMTSFTDKEIFRELEEVFQECSSDGWDGERAKPVSKEVLRSTAAFLESLPPGVEPPQIAAEPDGAISLEWYRSPEKVISVSVNPGGEVYYAAIIGTRRNHGKGSVRSGVSDNLLALVGKVTEKNGGPRKIQEDLNSISN